MAKPTKKKVSKKLTPRDVVLGIGRKATTEELDAYVERPRKGKFKAASQLRKEIVAHLVNRQANRKAS